MTTGRRSTVAVQNTPSKPTVHPRLLTDDEYLIPVRRIEPHTGPALWVIANPGQYIALRVRAWAWTDADGNGEVYHGPLALWEGHWVYVSIDAPDVFDSEGDANAVISSTLT
jgi:hypothetical protein